MYFKIKPIKFISNHILSNLKTNNISASQMDIIKAYARLNNKSIYIEQSKQKFEFGQNYSSTYPQVYLKFNLISHSSNNILAYLIINTKLYKLTLKSHIIQFYLLNPQSSIIIQHYPRLFKKNNYQYETL